MEEDFIFKDCVAWLSATHNLVFQPHPHPHTIKEVKSVNNEDGKRKKELYSGTAKTDKQDKINGEKKGEWKSN